MTSDPSRDGAPGIGSGPPAETGAPSGSPSDAEDDAGSGYSSTAEDTDIAVEDTEDELVDALLSLARVLVRRCEPRAFYESCMESGDDFLRALRRDPELFEAFEAGRLAGPTASPR